jgi:hypothetical protein
MKKTHFIIIPTAYGLLTHQISESNFAVRCDKERINLAQIVLHLHFLNRNLSTFNRVRVNERIRFPLNASDFPPLSAGIAR